jgi:16S rRNA G527 N7-methylase RsmG
VARGELSTNSILISNLQVAAHPSASMVQETALKKLLSSSNKDTNITSIATLKRLQQNQDFAFAGLPVNPSHSFWLEMLENGFPGIKIDLIRKNPSNVQDYIELVKLLNDSGFSLRDTNNLIYSNVSRSITVRIRQMIRW